MKNDNFQKDFRIKSAVLTSLEQVSVKYMQIECFYSTLTEFSSPSYKNLQCTLLLVLWEQHRECYGQDSFGKLVGNLVADL